MYGGLLDPPGIEIAPPETETQESAVLPLLRSLSRASKRLSAINLS